jgi:hypothetical protein
LWLGARQFDAGPLDPMVERLIMTGAFGGFLIVTFKRYVRQFNFAGSTHAAGRTLLEYSFQVASENSSYKVKIPGSSVKSGYSGMVLVDAATTDVVGLTVKTAALPAAANSCEISMNLDLQMAKIGDSEFLLPDTHASGM